MKDRNNLLMPAGAFAVFAIWVLAAAFGRFGSGYLDMLKAFGYPEWYVSYAESVIYLLVALVLATVAAIAGGVWWGMGRKG
jgi:hypothetical protein